MVGTSDKAVIDYLEYLLVDVNLPPIHIPNPWQDHDSVDQGYRIQPCYDVFTLMSMKNPSTAQLWEGFLQLLVIGSRLPEGQVQSYVFMQSQILYQKAQETLGG